MERRVFSSEERTNSLRVTQTNMVYIVGLPQNIASHDILISDSYLGQYGKVVKVAIKETFGNKSETFCGYITFSSDQEASLAILALQDFSIDNNRISASYGTTKYCSAFLRYGQCRKQQCLFHHKIEKQKEIKQENNKKVFHNQQKMARQYLLKNIQQINLDLEFSNSIFPSRMKVKQRLIDEGIIQLKCYKQDYKNQINQNNPDLLSESTSSSIYQSLLMKKIKKANLRKISYFNFVPNVPSLEFEKISQKLSKFVQKQN